MNPINLLTTVVKAAWNIFKGRQVVQLQSNNNYTTGYTINNVLMATPYGVFSIPNDNTNALLLPVNGSPKSLTAVGFIQSLPADTPISITTGESAYTSNGWALVIKNTGLIANKLDNPAYTNAWLINGPWVNFLILNRINEISGIISQMNVNINDLITWAALVTTATGVSPLVQMDLTVPTTLSSDTNYINNENDLLNDNAISPP